MNTSYHKPSTMIRPLLIGAWPVGVARASTPGQFSGQECPRSGTRRTSFVSFVSFCEKKIGSTLFFTEGNKGNEVSRFSDREASRSDREEADNVDRIFNHGCTRIDTDSRSIIRVYPCSSVVELIWLQLRPSCGLLPN